MEMVADMAKGPFRGPPEPGLALLRPKLGLLFMLAALPLPKLEPAFAPAGFPSVLRLRAAPRTPLAECCAAFVSMARRFRVSGLGLQSRRCGARTDPSPGMKPSDRGLAAPDHTHYLRNAASALLLWLAESGCLAIFCRLKLEVTCALA